MPRFVIGTKAVTSDCVKPYATWHTDTGAVWLECKRGRQGITLSFPGLADFHLSRDVLDVTCFPCSGADAATVDNLFRNQVRPLLLSAWGERVFHGAAVTIGGGAIAFLGRTGLGKSTLATAFARNGYPFLSDDVVQIGAASDGFPVNPVDASVRLWSQSRDWFFDRRRAAAPAASYTRKSRLPAGYDLPHATRPQPLRAAFILADEGAPGAAIVPISGQTAHLAWVQHSFLLEPDRNDVIAANFHAAADLAGKIPCFTLDYPREFAQLAPLVDHLVAFVEEVTA